MDRKYKASKKRLKKLQDENFVYKPLIYIDFIADLSLLISSYLFLSHAWVRIRQLVQYRQDFSSFTFMEIKVFVYEFLVFLLAPLVIKSCSKTLMSLIVFKTKINFKNLAPKFESFIKVNYSKKVFKELIQVFLKLLVIGLIVSVFFVFLSLFFSKIKLISLLIIRSDFLILLKQVILLCISLIAILASYSLLCLFIEKRKFKKKSLMTLEEVKEENKDERGDPNIKNMRKNLHERILEKKLENIIRNAKVIIIN